MMEARSDTTKPIIKSSDELPVTAMVCYVCGFGGIVGKTQSARQRERGEGRAGRWCLVDDEGWLFVVTVRTDDVGG